MEKFAIGIAIGASLNSTFNAALATSQEKIKGLTSSVQTLSAQKMAVTEVTKYRAELVALGNRQQQLTGRSREFSRELAAAKAGLQAANAKAQAMGINIGRLTDEERRLEAALKNTNRAIGARTALAKNKQFRAELQGDMLGATATAMMAAQPVMAAVGFESAMADVKKVVDFETPEAFQEMGRDILALSTRIPFAAEGLSKIVAAAGQSGIAKSSAELLAFAEDAAKMGVAFDIEASEAGTMMANWRAAMALNQGQAVSLANAVNHLSNNMNAQAGAIGEVIQRQGAVAKAAGLTEIQTASLAGALLSSGAGPEIAATAMKNLTGALTRGYAATKAQQDAFAALGLDAQSMAKAMQEDAEGAIMTVFTALQSMPVEEQSALISELFGEESKGAIAPLLANLDNLRKAFGLTADAAQYGGSMQAEFSSRAATTANNLTLLRNRVSRAGVSIGSVLLPALNAIVVPIGAVFDGVSWLAAKFPTLTTGVTATAVVLLALPAVTLAVKYGMSLMADGVQMARLALSFLGRFVNLTKVRLIALAVTQKAVALGSKVLAAAQVALGAAMTVGLGPIAAIVAAVAALAAGAYLVVKHWDVVGPFFARMWEGIKQVFLNFTPVGLLIQAFDKVKTFLATIDWSQSGMAIVKTLAAGMLKAAAAPVAAVKGVLTKVREFLPFSDAKTGPLSQLTASGKALVVTIGKGMVSGAGRLAAITDAVLQPLLPNGQMLPMGNIGGSKGQGGMAARGGGVVINISMDFAGTPDGSVKKEIEAGGEQLARKIRQVLRDLEQDKRRAGYGGVAIG